MPNYPANGDTEAAKKILDDAGIKPDANGVRATATLDLIPYGSAFDCNALTPSTSARH